MYKYFLTPILLFPYLAYADFVRDASGNPLVSNGGGVTDFASLLDRLTSTILQPLIPVLFGVALVLFIWALIQYLTKAGESQTEIRQTILWGIIILAVMSGVWGLVKIMQNSVFGNANVNTAPHTPRIQ